ncbi:MAG: 50S ribosomal protein L24 [Kiritimatiellia bacterium]
MSIARIKKGDTVIAAAGVDLGRTGRVLQVFPGRGRALVEGLHVVKKAMRKTQDNPQGGIGEREASVDISNLMVYCPDCKRGVRMKKETEGDRKVRKCGRCGRVFE